LNNPSAQRNIPPKHDAPQAHLSRAKTKKVMKLTTHQNIEQNIDGAKAQLKEQNAITSLDINATPTPVTDHCSTANNSSISSSRADSVNESHIVDVMIDIEAEEKIGYHDATPKTGQLQYVSSENMVESDDESDKLSKASTRAKASEGEPTKEKQLLPSEIMDLTGSPMPTHGPTAVSTFASDSSSTSNKRIKDRNLNLHVDVIKVETDHSTPTPVDDRGYFVPKAIIRADISTKTSDHTIPLPISADPLDCTSKKNLKESTTYKSSSTFSSTETCDSESGISSSMSDSYFSSTDKIFKDRAEYISKRAKKREKAAKKKARRELKQAADRGRLDQHEHSRQSGFSSATVDHNLSTSANRAKQPLTMIYDENEYDAKTAELESKCSPMSTAGTSTIPGTTTSSSVSLTGPTKKSNLKTNIKPTESKKNVRFASPLLRISHIHWNTPNTKLRSSSADLLPDIAESTVNALDYARSNVPITSESFKLNSTINDHHTPISETNANIISSDKVQPKMRPDYSDLENRE
jgi:hypothetical protein